MNATILPAETTQILAQVIRRSDVAYAYDVFSNHILRLTENEASMLGELLHVPRDSPPSTHAPYEVTSFLSEARDLGVLQPVPSRTRIAEPPTRHALHNALSKHIGSVCLQVTQACSLRCKYCIFSGQYPGIRTHSRKSMPITVALQAVDFLLDHSSMVSEDLNFSFYGGEPLLRLDLVERVVKHVARKAIGRAYRFNMTTNGLALSKPSVRAFLARNDVSLLVSMDGPPSIHDSQRVTRSGRHTHHLILAGLEALMHEYPAYYERRIGFNAVVSTNADLLACAEYFSASEIYRRSRKSLRISAVDTFGREDQMSRSLQKEPCVSQPTPAAVRHIFLENRKSSVTPNDCLDGINSLLMTRIAKRRIGVIDDPFLPIGYCIPGARKLFVSVDGTLEICEKMNGLLPIGNLSEGLDYDGIDRILQQLYAMWNSWRSHCERCIAQRFCGICPTELLSPKGTLSVSRFDQHCRHYQAHFVQVLGDFIELCTINPAYYQRLVNANLS